MHIQKLELLSLDLTAQRDCYQNVLELPAELNPSGLALQAGSTEILFKQGPLDFEGAYHFAFNIPENQFKAAMKWLTGGENPNKPGTHYINRYLDHVEVGGTVTQQQPAAARPGTSTPDVTRGSVERQVIVKEMVSHYPGIDKLSVDGWWGLKGELEEFVANGIPKVAPVIDEHGATAEDIPF